MVPQSARRCVSQGAYPVADCRARFLPAPYFPRSSPPVILSEKKSESVGGCVKVLLAGDLLQVDLPSLALATTTSNFRVLYLWSLSVTTCKRNERSNQWHSPLSKRDANVITFFISCRVTPWCTSRTFCSQNPPVSRRQQWLLFHHRNQSCCGHPCQQLALHHTSCHNPLWEHL